VPGSLRGWSASPYIDQGLAARMGGQKIGVREAFALAAGCPEAFIPNAVGTSYVFGQTA